MSRVEQSVLGPSADDDIARAAARHWGLDPDIAFLNHGSFGACPIAVLEEQSRLRERIERQPVQFFARDLEGLRDAAREALAAFLNVEPRDLAFVRNATMGVAAVLGSYPLRAGDEVLATNHEYNACRNALRCAADRAGARVVVADIPFPIASSDEVIEAVAKTLTPRTRLALVSHVTSPTALMFPIERLARLLAERGVDLLVDGAHAPGMTSLDLDAIGCAYYTGNCHKWLCSPKGAGFLWARRDKQVDLHPAVISHGFNSPRTDKPRFQLEFDWIGTDDPTPALCAPSALALLPSLAPGGWLGLLARNRALALEARDILCAALDIEPPAPDSMIGSMASVPLPPLSTPPPASPLQRDPLQDWLLRERGIEVNVTAWPAPPNRLLRVSAQLYNDRSQYDRLAAALREAPRWVGDRARPPC